MILVTTAGKVGAEAALVLSQRDVPVRVLTRHPEKAAALADAGVQIAVGDLDERASIDAAMEGVTSVILVSPAVPAQELTVVASAARAGVGHVVKASSKASADSPIARRRWQTEIEAGLAASGVPHTLLRSNGYMQNTLMLAPVIAKTDGFGSSAGAGLVGMVDARDVAAVAAEIAASPGPARREDLPPHRPGAHHQRRRGRRAVEAARQGHHPPAPQLQRGPRRHDQGRRPGTGRGDERPGLHPDRGRRRRMAQRRRPVDPRPPGPLLPAVRPRLRPRVLLDRHREGPGNDMTDLKGKTALITGATSGIGRATALALAARGAHVLVTGRNEQRAADLTAEIEKAGGSAAYHLTALSDVASVRELARWAVAAGDGHVDILVNNAGVALGGPSDSATEAEFDETFTVNVKVPFFLVAALAPAMAERGWGAIVSTSTMVASFGQPGLAMYGASRAAIELLTKAWAAEYGPRGVRVNAIAPGPTRTPTSDAHPDMMEMFAAQAPAGRPAKPEEMAAAIAYLASDDASFVHGVTLAVDGGRVASAPQRQEASPATTPIRIS